MSDTVKARWVGGFRAILPDGTELNHGDEYRINAGEAAQSDNWEPIVAAPKASKTAEEA